MKKGVLKNFAIITENTCVGVSSVPLFCQKLIKGLLKKEAVRFLQSEEISFKLPYNLHYNSNKFYLEAHHLFHPQIMSTYISKNFLVLLQNVILKSEVL